MAATCGRRYFFGAPFDVYGSLSMIYGDALLFHSATPALATGVFFYNFCFLFVCCYVLANDGKLLGFTGFFTGLYRVLLLRCPLVILGFTGFVMGFTGFYWVFTGFQWVLLGFYCILLALTGLH